MGSKLKKITRLIGKILFIFAFGSLGALWANYYLLPEMSDWPVISRAAFLKRFKENVTIINKTEQITVSEDSAISKVASAATASVVRIVSVPEPGAKTALPAGASIKEGNGMIVTGDGLVATYRSVILEKGADYKVLTSGGHEFDAELAGIDNFTNLAYLKIKGANFTSLPFSNSNDVAAGKRVIGVGLAVGEQQNDYFPGTINGLDRNFNISGEAVSNAGKLEGVFRIDFGSEDVLGAPVISYAGELVGIVGSSVLDNHTRFFLIPANRVKESMEKHFRGELEKISNLGVSYVSLSRSFAIAHDLKETAGALIFSPSGKQGLAILANSPAEKAGLRINDIIVSVEGQPIDLDHPLSNLMSNYQKGSIIKLKVLRGGAEMEIPVAL